MALDIALLDNSGSPIATIAIGVNTHWELIQLAQSQNLELILRLRDYYGEASFFQQELASLSRELQVVASSGSASPELVRVARSVMDLSDRARSAGRGLEAIPD